MALTLDLAFGARVTRLTDRSTNREWLLQGPRARDVSDIAAYRGAASRGWDECFPTILPCHSAPWGGMLRDHGMLWGRPWTVFDPGPQQIGTRFDADGVTFARVLTLQGPGLTAAYSVTSQRDVPMPYLWSQHCVLATRPGDQISLTGQGVMRAGDTAFQWPDHPTRDLTHVGDLAEGFTLKAYALTPDHASAQISGPRGGLRFDWDGAEIPALGLWLDYGGWPAEDPLHQVALEPATATADDLAGAEALGQARWLAPGETHRWTVRLTLTGDDGG